MHAPATSMIHIRVNNKLKKQASQALEKMGLSVSDAVRMMLTRVVNEKTLPFDIHIPNEETILAMKAVERGEVFTAHSIKELMAQLNADD